jgi:hypothetical protein
MNFTRKNSGVGYEQRDQGICQRDRQYHYYCLYFGYDIRTFVIEGRIIPSGSMLQTLQLQDRVMVNKFIYFY